MSINEYLEAHPTATENEAFWKCVVDQATSLGLDFLGGVIMGGTMGSGGAGIKSMMGTRGQFSCPLKGDDRTVHLSKTVYHVIAHLYTMLLHCTGLPPRNICIANIGFPKEIIELSPVGDEILLRQNLRDGKPVPYGGIRK